MNKKIELQKCYKEYFHEDSDAIFECGGRFELLGNHTDHNHGLCLAAACDMSITTAVKIRHDNKVIFYSEGYDEFELDLSDLISYKEEYATSKGLVRGICAYLKQHNYQIGGFNAYTKSSIFSGAGVSSSAAFELVIGQIENYLFNDNKIDRLTLCKAGQFAENNYFGKASGLLDQIGVAYPGIKFIDFKNIDKPNIELIKEPFKGLHFILINSGGSHALLSSLYSEIPNDMYAVAKAFNKKHLIEIDFNDYLNERNNKELNARQLRRSLHFFEENIRVLQAKEALINHDIDTFLKLINASQKSSQTLLENTQLKDHYNQSPQEAIDFANTLLVHGGAAKINGGGFAGSVICLVKEIDYKHFMREMINKYSKENVFEVSIRNKGSEII